MSRLDPSSKAVILAALSDCSTSTRTSEQATYQYDKPLIVPAIKEHTATVIFVHGSGDSANGMKPFAQLLNGEDGLEHIEWVIPTAPLRPMSLLYGMLMPSWYDIPSHDLVYGAEDEPGTLESARYIHSLISEAIERGMPAERIVLAGFSQGGTMSIVTGLTCEERIGGIACMSGRTVMREKLKTMVKPHATSIPIFWSHGTEDNLVTYELGQFSVQYLISVIGIPKAKESDEGGGGIEFHGYEGVEHRLAWSTLEDFGKWLRRVVPSFD